MKTRIAALVTAGVLALSMLTGCGSKQESWKVTCPWAPSGVAAMVSQKAAAKSPDYSEKKITLVAEAVKGDAATVNTWVASTKANDKELVFAGEGLFAITETLDPAKLQFSYDDFEFVENLYSSVFVLSADSSLNLKSLDDLEAYVKAGNPVSVAVNGATGSEAFLAAALFGSMGAGDQLKLTPYQSAAEAAQAVAKGETNFAVSHQSQILETYQQGGVDVVCAFDDKAIENAAKLGFRDGAALYPMVTVNGEECHNEWEITFEEIHRNGAVAYAIFNYIRYTGDTAYLADCGLEVLLSVARFWAQRITWSGARRKYVMLGVTGPNEYENNVDNNWYTSYIACWSMRYGAPAAGHIGVMQAVGQRDRECIHGKAYAQQGTVEEKDETPLHKNCLLKLTGNQWFFCGCPLRHCRAVTAPPEG